MCNMNFRKLRILATLFLILPLSAGIPLKACAQKDSLTFVDDGESGLHSFAYRVGIEFASATIIPTEPFYEGENNGNPLRNALSAHVRYSFGLPIATLGHKVFAETYQGVGLAYYNFASNKELGNPFLAYLFQRSRIAKLHSNLFLDYEWNFGISVGWKPYDYYKNPKNVIIGSKLNAYLNAGVYMTWKTGERLSLTGGAEFTHFSNGNTEYPNAGLNTAGLRVGAIYDVSDKDYFLNNKKGDLIVPDFPQHFSYDFVVFGSWRRKGVAFSGKQFASPDKYPVVGAYFAPMYNFRYRFRAGPSLNVIYDGSANVYTEDYIAGTEQKFFKPGFDRQIALGISARAEYIMPVFTISMGVGRNVIHKGGDLRGFYQSLALKIRTSRSSFFHIGYNLKDFKEPNYLMLGLGYRFNNKTPSLLKN